MGDLIGEDGLAALRALKQRSLLLPPPLVRLLDLLLALLLL